MLAKDIIKDTPVYFFKGTDRFEGFVASSLVTFGVAVIRNYLGGSLNFVKTSDVVARHPSPQTASTSAPNRAPLGISREALK